MPFQISTRHMQRKMFVQRSFKPRQIHYQGFKFGDNMNAFPNVIRCFHVGRKVLPTTCTTYYLT